MDLRSLFVGIVAGAFLVCAVLWYIWRRAPAYVIRWDGVGLTGFKAKVAPGGVEVKTPDGAITYPASAARRVVLNKATGLSAYVVAADEVPLVRHEALEIGRNGIAFAAMFKSEGDMMRYLRMGAVIVPMAVALYLYSQFSGIQSSLTNQSADVKAALVVLNRLAPAPAPTATPEVKP